MGLSSSKHNAAPPSSSSSSGAAVRRSRSIRRTVLKSSCLGSHHSSNDDPQVFGCQSEENGKTVSCSSENESGSCQVSAKYCRKDKAEQSYESSFTDSASRENSSSSRAFSSRFSFSPGNLSFRLTRANGVGSTRANPASSTTYAGFTDNDRPQGCDFFPACFTNRSLRILHEDPANTILPSSSPGDFSSNLQNNPEPNSDYDCSPNLISPNYNSEIRHVNRHAAAREPAEPNIRFSRTLSVGRLRDRVLRRTPVHELDLHHFQREFDVRHSTGRRGFGHSTMEATSEDNFHERVSYNDVAARIYNPFYGGQNNEPETPRARETRYRDLLEHRSNFLERRRRIRSQVRALQRLGSRFENLSGHERSCILSGQNRAGHCTCRTTGRGVYSNDDATARASISRIVILAEALFEVLDEIQQQTVVVLTARPSVSSIGSIPAPNEVVDALPLKIFGRSKKKLNEEAAQCYICLVEYEEGESMRILPCHHDFHRACVDKWLKEVHRICPLCRGDVCRPEPSTRES